MAESNHWLLPEGIVETLPPDAWSLERLRRKLLDLYRAWGYELVQPPFVEYLESLLTGSGSDLDLQTFKLTDQITGRTLGIRADITPQAARIDAHQLRRECPTRLCYLGTVLTSRSDEFGGSRSPLQIGAELYGHAGIEADLEVLNLLLESLQVAGLNELYLDLGHVGIFRGLARQAGLKRQQELTLFDALQRKAIPEIEALVEQYRLPLEQGEMLASLGSLSGDDAIQQARIQLAAATPEVHAAIDELERLAKLLAQSRPALQVHCDLAELRGYHYHTGVMFAVFVPGRGQEVARGGRYDDVGQLFGRARPACGFSADLNLLFGLGTESEPPSEQPPVFAPWSDDPGLHRVVEALRAEGRRVVLGLPGQSADASGMGCGAVLEKQGERWVVGAL